MQSKWWGEGQSTKIAHGCRSQPATVPRPRSGRGGAPLRSKGPGEDEHERGHQRTFNVARPISTSTTLMIQKRTITRGSGQPLSSK